jgi:hypothetical protein
MSYPMWDEIKRGILVDRGAGILAYLESGPEFESLKAVAEDWHNYPVSVKQPTADEIRTERNQLLSACDWTQLPDAQCDQTAWAAYRQALRDIPQQEGFPAAVIWPVPPT